MCCKCHCVDHTCVQLQALADAETSVIAEAVRFLTAVCHERQIRKPALLAAARKVVCLSPTLFVNVCSCNVVWSQPSSLVDTSNSMLR